jgi:hypothetical protein
MYCKNAKADAFILRLSNLLSDDWKKDKKQEWKASDFSDCAKLRYKVIFSSTFYAPVFRTKVFFCQNVTRKTTFIQKNAHVKC